MSGRGFWMQMDGWSLGHGTHRLSPSKKLLRRGKTPEKLQCVAIREKVQPVQVLQPVTMQPAGYGMGCISVATNSKSDLLRRPSLFGWLQVGPFLLAAAALLNVTCCTEMEGEGLEDYIMRYTVVQMSQDISCSTTAASYSTLCCSYRQGTTESSKYRDTGLELLNLQEHLLLPHSILA